MEKLEKDLAARVNWGSCQHPVISEFDMSSAGERKLGMMLLYLWFSLKG
jgi:hypothetical protein